jgi:hypothetical protein
MCWSYPLYYRSILILWQKQCCRYMFSMCISGSWLANGSWMEWHSHLLCSFILHTKETCPISIDFILFHTFQLECKTQGNMCTKMHYLVHSLIKHRNCSLGLPLGIVFSSPCCTNIIARSQVGAGMEQTMHVKRVG